MSTVTALPTARPVLPGWTLVADLTPPELIEARRLRVLRRLILSGLGLVVVFCLAGYALAMLRHAAAESALRSEQQTTVQLQQQANRYAGITRIQTTINGVDARVAKQFAGDVDINGFISGVAKARPVTVTVSNLAVTLFPAAGTGAPAQSQSQTVNVSGHPLIGTVTLSGKAASITDVGAYVEQISKLPGVVGVLPTSSQRDASGVQFTLKFSVTDQLLSHRFTGSTGKAGH